MGSGDPVAHALVGTKAAISAVLDETVYVGGDQEYVQGGAAAVVFGSLMDDFCRCPVDSRDPKLIKLVSSCISCMRQVNPEQLLAVFAKVMVPSMQTIGSKSGENHIEVEKELLGLCKTMCWYRPNELMKMPSDQRGFFFGIVKFGCQHYNSGLCSLSYGALYALFRQFPLKIDGVEQVCGEVAMDFLRLAFENMKDICKKCYFEEHLRLIRVIIQIPYISRDKKVILDMLLQVFPDKPPQMMAQLVQDMIRCSSIAGEFRVLIRNFFAQIAGVTPMDPDLLVEERRAAHESLRQKFAGVPGYMDATEVEEKGEDTIMERLSERISDMKIQKYSG